LYQKVQGFVNSNTTKKFALPELLLVNFHLTRLFLYAFHFKVYVFPDGTGGIRDGTRFSGSYTYRLHP